MPIFVEPDSSLDNEGKDGEQRLVSLLADNGTATCMKGRC